MEHQCLIMMQEECTHYVHTVADAGMLGAYDIDQISQWPYVALPDCDSADGLLT